MHAMLCFSLVDEAVAPSGGGGMEASEHSPKKAGD